MTAPLVPSEVDLRDFAFMPLEVGRLRDSDLSKLSTGDEFRCAVLLWCAAWHQIPAASLPNDDRVLSDLAGFGRVTREWKKAREGALRGWVLCDDGRLYHPVIAEKAKESWARKLDHRYRTECARLRKAAERNHTQAVLPSFEQWISASYPQETPTIVASDNGGMSHTTPPPCRSGNGIQGTVDRDRDNITITGAGAPPVVDNSKTPPPSQKATAETILDYLNRKANCHYRAVPATLKFIEQRLKDGADAATCMLVIDLMCKKWLGTEYSKFLRPETLFNATKFESYRGEIKPGFQGILRPGDWSKDPVQVRACADELGVDINGLELPEALQAIQEFEQKLAQRFSQEGATA